MQQITYYIKPENLSYNIEDKLQKIIGGLSAKKFLFLKSEQNANDFKERIEKFDEKRLNLTRKLFNFYIGITDCPPIAQTIMKNIFSFTAINVEEKELQKLQNLMVDNFPLCCMSAGAMCGPRFVPIIYDDNLTKDEILDAIERFQNINLTMLPLGGRLALKIFGTKLRMNASSVTGSLIIISPNPDRTKFIQNIIDNIPFESDTILNQLKERFSRWQFWVKSLIGFIEYKPNQLRQEIIIVDSQTGTAKSNINPRLGFEFGFELRNITA